jgi:hypothetical protein
MSTALSSLLILGMTSGLSHSHPVVKEVPAHSNPGVVNPSDRQPVNPTRPQCDSIVDDDDSDDLSPAKRRQEVFPRRLSSFGNIAAGFSPFFPCAGPGHRPASRPFYDTFCTLLI